VVQAPFADQPSTAIYRPGATDAEDRQYVLPEMLRVMQQVQSILEQTTAATTMGGGFVANHDAAGTTTTTTTTTTATSSTPTSRDLPWNVNDTGVSTADDEESTVDGSVDATTSADGVLSSASSVEHPTSRHHNHVPPPSSSSSSSRRQQREQQRTLRSLAPLLDRLGRAMVDLAPHVASLAAAMEPTEEVPEESQLDTIEEHPGSLGGLLSMLSRDRRRNSMASSQAVASLSTADQTTTVDQATVATASSEVSTMIDPDYTDFATGVVNTVRGEVRTGPRARSAIIGGGGSSPSDELSSLLGAYVAAATLASEDSGTGNGDDSNLQMLGRLLRDSGGGSGIDIHIHAVVTAPGMMNNGPTTGTALGQPTFGTTTTNGGGGLGALLAGLGVTDAATTNNTTNDAGTRAAALAADLESFLPVAQRVTSETESMTDDDMGIFSELYSENPTPISESSLPSSSTQLPTVSPSSSPARRRQSPGRSGRSHGTSSSSPPSGSRSRGSPSRTNNNGTLSRSTTTATNSGSNNSSRRQGFLGRFLRRNQGTE
jgi:hypothetical protein